MIAKLFEVKKTTEKGSGLFAKQYIPTGTIICFECERCERFAPGAYEALNAEQKKPYEDFIYRKADGSHLMACDETIYLNHSCNANVLDTGRGYDIVVRDIQPGEEVTYDYRTFHEVDLDMDCYCGEANCCHRVICEHPLPEELAQDWKQKLQHAFAKAPHVVQPLRAEMHRQGVSLPFLEPALSMQ